MYSERCAGRSERSNWRSSSVGAAFSASAALVAFGIGELNCEGEPRPWSTSPCTPCLRGVYSFEIYHGDTESTEKTTPWFGIGGQVRRLNKYRYAFANDRRLRRKIVSTDSSPPSSIA